MLQVDGLGIAFAAGAGRAWPVVSDVSFAVARGEILALVGESGCGKSVTCLALARLLPEPPARYTAGQIRFAGGAGRPAVDALRLDARGLRELRRHRLGYVFQEPAASFNPVLTVGAQLVEAVILRGGNASPEATAAALLSQTGIPDAAGCLRRYPHELSGGMLQRAMLAMALAGNPELLVADEPTTALDVTIQAQILDLLRRLKTEAGLAVLLVTHNLGLVADLADRVVVMYAGHTVEAGTTAGLLTSPRHPYTRALLAAVPILGRTDRQLIGIPGSVPSPAAYPPGCRFLARCPLAASLTPAERERCRLTVPAWCEIRNGHFCRCHYSR